VCLSPRVFGEHFEEVLSMAHRQSKAVHDFEVRYRFAKAASIIQGRFVGQHKDEIYIG
jgi:hypothetical protein